MLQANADLNKKLRELETNLNKANDELKDTKETLQVALNTMGQYKEENIDLQNKLYKYNRDHQADEMFKRSDVTIQVFQLRILFFSFSFYTLTSHFADLVLLYRSKEKTRK